MNAFDTNIVVRILVDDDPKQSATARAAVEAGGFISKTVVLETVWVLESAYGFERDLILGALLDLAALPKVKLWAWPRRCVWRKRGFNSRTRTTSPEHGSTMRC